MSFLLSRVISTSVRPHNSSKPSPRQRGLIQALEIIAEMTVRLKIPCVILISSLVNACASIARPPTAKPVTDWLEPVPSALGYAYKWTRAADDSFFEIPASGLDTAEYWLRDVTLLPQDSGDEFGRPDFVCQFPSKLYLLRASYINGGTGSFILYWSGPALIIAHGSLGHGGPASKSALVACLDKEPTAVYGSVSSAL